MEVADMVGVRPSRVTYHTNLYIKNGGFLMVYPERILKRRGKIKVTRELIDYIRDPKILRSWAHLNLAARSE